MRSLPFLLLSTLIACDKSTEDSEPTSAGEAIDCTWFEADNCWTSSVTAAQACAAPVAETGVFSAEVDRCTFTDGTEIVFAEPLNLDDLSNQAWNFEVFKSSASCMSFQESDEGLTLTTGEGTFVEDMASMAVVMQCPSGDAYTMSGFAMMECDWNLLPGYMTSYGGDSVTFMFMGQEDPIFSCAAAR